MPKVIRYGPRARVQSVDWIRMRDAFINRPERPTLVDLSTEFGCSLDRVTRASHDEGWPALRAARLDAALRNSDAVKVLLDAAKTEGMVQRSMTNVALELLAQLQDIAQEAGRVKGKAENTRANTLNTVTFALRNLAGALKDVGLVGLPRALKNQPGMADEQGRWNPAMLASLNVTVQNIVGSSSQKADSKPSGAISEAIDEATIPTPPPALAQAAESIAIDPAELAQPEREPVPVGADADVI